MCGLHLRLSKPQWQHVIRMADALIVSDTRHKTSAGLYRLIVDAPDASNGADSLRLSPWTTEDLRARLLEAITVDEDDLRRLAQERAAQIQDFLVKRAAVPAERIYLLGAKIDGHAQKEVVETTLELTAG